MLLPPPFLPGRQLPDLLRRFPIRYSCSGTVCLFVWSVGADKPFTYSLYREENVMHRLFLLEIAL